MATIAFIGSDGAGKTTIIEKLSKEFPANIKCIYMGLNLESSNYSLPTSRVLLKMKLNAIRREAIKNGNQDPEYLSTHHISHRMQERGKIVRIARLVNRIFEAGYRLIISCIFEFRGYLVVYDRHFLFDSAPDPNKKVKLPFSTRIFRFFLEYLYAKPDLVIFLDADPEILLQRKQEVHREYLISQRYAILAQGKSIKNFYIVDTSGSINKVFSDVSQVICNNIDFKNTNKPKCEINYSTPESN